MSKLNEKVEALFQAAVALETEAQRADYLNRACPDPELRREVESLLAAHDHPDALLATHPEPARPTIKLDLPDAKDEAGRAGSIGCRLRFNHSSRTPVNSRVLRVSKMTSPTGKKRKRKRNS